MSDEPQVTDWWQASDGKWYPTTFWQASDGKWYPPEARPQGSAAGVATLSPAAPLAPPDDLVGLDEEPAAFGAPSAATDAGTEGPAEGAQGSRRGLLIGVAAVVVIAAVVVGIVLGTAKSSPKHPSAGATTTTAAPTRHTTTTVKSSGGGAATPSAIMTALETDLNGGKLTAICTYAVPANQSSCQSSIQSDVAKESPIIYSGLSTGSIRTQGDQAIAVMTGQLCVQSKCTANNDQSLDSGQSFGSVYADVTGNNTLTFFVVPFTQQGGHWYVART